MCYPPDLVITDLRMPNDDGGAIERIEIVPDGERLTANLYGHLAGILALATNGREPVNGAAEWFW